jgi:hypothetical protein
MEKQPTEFWNLLGRVSRLEFRVRSKLMGQKMGTAQISVHRPKKNQYLFEEIGHWSTGEKFKNRFVWTLANGTLHLEREGHLFTLIPAGIGKLFSKSPYHCGPDTYTISIEWTEESIHMQCNAIGPSKEDLYDYLYTFE